MATYARHLVQAGAKIVGGCCGTTPEHIAAMVEGVRPLVAASGTRAGARSGGRRMPDLAARESRRRSPYRLAQRSKWARQDRARRVRDVGRDRAAARRGCVEDAARHGQTPECRSGRGQRARRPARAEPHGRAAHERADRAAGRHRDRHALLLPRSQSPRHAERSSRRGGGRTAQHAPHHGRSAEDGSVSERHRGVRHRRDRSHESREPAESRTGSGRQRDRRADAVR